MAKKEIQPRDPKRIFGFKQEVFSGPLPHPDTLAKYEQICPGAADRILSMAEEQAGHRQKLERRVIASNISNERTGMILAFVISIALMGAGSFLIYNDKDGLGFISLLIPPLFHGGSFIYRKYVEKKELKEKKQQVQQKEQRQN